MALPRKVLLKKASRFELKILTKENIDMENLSGLDRVLNDVYALRCPKPIDYHNRKDLIRIFNIIAKEIYGNSDECPFVEGFGSFIMDMFSPGSDLDLSINFGSANVECSRDKKIQTLKKISKKLHTLQRQGHVTKIQRIMTARVPIVKVIDLGTRIECDISVENWDGILKSQLIHVISAIDERFQKLSFLMKTWAKANGINSSKDHTLNSLSIISLVAFHLQTRDPPILPPFSLLLKDGTEPKKVRKNVDTFIDYGKTNKESIAQLFVSLLIKLSSVEKLWQKGLCASLYSATWTSKAWDSQCSPMSIEDFTDRSQNVSRAVGTSEAKTIYDCIHNSLNCLLLFLDGHIERTKMGELLFGSEDALSPLVKLVPNHNHGGSTGSRKNKKRKRRQDSDGVNASKPLGENLPCTAITGAPPLIPSLVNNTAMSAINLAGLCNLLPQQPTLPQWAPESSTAQINNGNISTSSWPHWGAK
ncbi:hypothetical protein SAY86_010141 [Trapa natans]|uniref:Poly(A) RNA polymerase mitochondrial-like central palm domain-containing protein n=1 Tax=Trapa natans TaxID=22666 RepID=A0AAN7L5S8_TRANT|nr:hypothetical protein SAY86_010141 [Trapa natans]